MAMRGARRQHPLGVMRWSPAAFATLGRIITFLREEDREIVGVPVVYWAERMARRRKGTAVGVLDVTAALKCIAYSEKEANVL